MKIIHVHNVAFVATTLVDALNEIDGVEAIFFEREPYSVGIKKHIKKMIEFKKLIKKEKPDIVHIHYLPTSLYAFFARTDYVLHVHGSDVRGLGNNTRRYNLKQKLHRKFKIYALKKAKLVLYSTPDLKEDVDAIRKDAIFLPNPVKASKFVTNDNKFKDNEINVLFFAALSNQKGADIAFPALEQIKKLYKEKVNITCINFGYDNEKYNTKEFVDYVDKIEHEKIDEFINKFDIIIGQLKVGAIGVSELEVMMQGIPLISYFKYNEFYEESCPLMSCDDSEDVVCSVEKLVESEFLREEIGNKQIQWVNKYHSDKNVVFKLINLYSEVNQPRSYL